MNLKVSIKTSVMLLVILSLLVSPFLTGCSSEPAQTSEGEKPAETKSTETETTKTETTETAVAEINEFDVVQEAAEKYMKSGSKWNISAKDVYTLINDDDEDNDPYIISARSADSYALGHVPGAVNLSFADLAKKENLDTLPVDELIVIYCYTGHTASQATARLGILGYEVLNMKHGMSDWTKNEEVAPNRFDPATTPMNYAVETTVNTATATYDFPVLDNTSSSDEAEILRAAAEAYESPRNITAKDLFTLINDDDDDNDPFIVSIRTAEQYAKGHIPGAINIAFTDIASKASLAKLPTDRPIVVYCYTGHTGSQATALLNMLGYDVQNLKFGMCAWTSDPEIAPGGFNPETSNDFAYETNS